MRSSFIIVVCIFLSATSNAQYDSIANEIYNYKGYKREMIDRGRALIIDNIRNLNIEKARLAKDYLLKEIESEYYPVFNLNERYLLMIWFGEYDALLDSVEKKMEEPDISNNIPYYNSFYNFSRYATDQFQEELSDLTFQHMARLEKELERGIEDETDRAFMKLFLKNALKGKNISLDDMNVAADSFLDEFASSAYEDYVRKRIRYVYRLSRAGMGYDLSVGGGVLTGDMSGTFSSPVPLGIGLEFEYLRFIAFLRLYVGFSKSLEDITYSSGVWSKGIAAEFYNSEWSGGFNIIDNSKFRISPFGGIITSSVAPAGSEAEDDPDLDELEFRGTPGYIFGLNFDFKGANYNTNSYRPQNSYGYIRIRYSFEKISLDKSSPEFFGNMHRITIGFGGFGRSLIREY